LKKAKVS